MKLAKLAALISLALIAGRADAGEVRAAVAANFTVPVQKIAELFQADTGHSVKASYGSTGKFYSQIKNGAPFDVLLAADQERPALLEERGGVAGTRFTYATGRLTLWSLDPELLKGGSPTVLGGPHPKVAYAAQHIETKLLGQQCGIQDQLASAYGGINFIDMDDYPHATVQSIRLPAPLEWEMESRLALVYLGREHSSSAVHELVIGELEAAGPECRQLADLRVTARKSYAALLSGDFATLGAAMQENTAAQQRLHPALRLLQAVAGLVLRRRRQRRLGATVVVGVAAAVEVGLGARLGLVRLAQALGVDEDDLERAAGSAPDGLGQLEVDRQRHGMDRQRGDQRQGEGAAGRIHAGKPGRPGQSHGHGSGNRSSTALRHGLEFYSGTASSSTSGASSASPSVAT